MKTFLKFLSRNKLYTAINVVGFAVSLAAVLLIVNFTLHKFATDSFHEKGERIYLLTDQDGSFFPAPLPRDLTARYPEIETALLADYMPLSATVQSLKYETSTLLTDSSFFNVFSYPLVEGERERALVTPHSAAVSRSFALKAFGGESPVGRQLALGEKEFIVEAVFEDFDNTLLRAPDVIVRIENVALWNTPEAFTSYGICNYAIFLLARPGSDLQAKIPDMEEFLRKTLWSFDENSVLHLLPLREAHFDSVAARDASNFVYTSPGMIAVLGAVVLLILLFAVINYVNLSVAQSGFRAKEMATRRLLGSSRWGVAARLLTESVMLCLAAFVLALLLAGIFEQLFNRMLGGGIDLARLYTPLNATLALAAVAVLGIVAGAVPAAVISASKPVEVVRGALQRRTKTLYGRILIAFQYMIVIGLMCGTAILYIQFRYMTSAGLGYDKEAILLIDNRLGDLSRAGAFRSGLLQLSGVEQVVLASGTPFDGGNNHTFTREHGKISFQIFEGEEDMLPLLGLRIVRDNGIRAARRVWFNQEAVRQMQLGDSTLVFDWYRKWFGDDPANDWPIAGTLSDFVYRDMTEPIGPLMVKIYKEFPHKPRCFLVKLSPGSLTDAYDRIEALYEQMSGGEPMKARFADEMIAARYQKERQTLRLVTLFTFVAILIATFGIVAMAAYFIRQREAEVAVRKVFGARNGEVFGRLIRHFAVLVLAAFVIAAPCVWLLARRWMEGYAYKAPIPWWVYPAAGVAALLLALASVSGESLRVARSNPIDHLKS